MMKTLDKGHEKIQKICNLLREETLEPAQKEAQQIIKAAQEQAEKILEHAQKEAAKIEASAKAAMQQEHNVFQASLLQGAKQALEALRQSIEENFFNANLASILEKSASDPQVVAKLLNAIIKAIENEGLNADLTALIPKEVSPRQVNELLLQDVVKTLKEHSVEVGDFSAGVRVKLYNRKMTIDISQEALKELLASYVVRKDFRKMIFAV